MSVTFTDCGSGDVLVAVAPPPRTHATAGRGDGERVGARRPAARVVSRGDAVTTSVSATNDPPRRDERCGAAFIEGTFRSPRSLDELVARIASALADRAAPGGLRCSEMHDARASLRASGVRVRRSETPVALLDAAGGTGAPTLLTLARRSATAEWVMRARDVVPRADGRSEPELRRLDTLLAGVLERVTDASDRSSPVPASARRPRLIGARFACCGLSHAASSPTRD